MKPLKMMVYVSLKTGMRELISAKFDFPVADPAQWTLTSIGQTETRFLDDLLVEIATLQTPVKMVPIIDNKTVPYSLARKLIKGFAEINKYSQSEGWNQEKYHINLSGS